MLGNKRPRNGGEVDQVKDKEETRKEAKKLAFSSASADTKKRVRYIRARINEPINSSQPSVNVKRMSENDLLELNDLAKFAEDLRVDKVVDECMDEYLRSGIDFLERSSFCPEFWMPLDVLRSIKKRRGILDEYTIGSLEYRLAEQELFAEDFKNKVGLSADYDATIKALGCASYGAGGLSPLNVLSRYAVGQAYLQIAVVELGAAHAFFKSEMNKALGSTSGLVGSDALELRIFHRNALELTSEMLKKELPNETPFYVQRIGASSAEDSPFKREGKQFIFDESLQKWVSNSKTCMVFKSLSNANLVKDYSVRIVGVAPLGDKKNGYRLEAALCLHFRACALFGSMSANITMGGPHDVVSFWSDPLHPLKQPRSMEAVRAIFNKYDVKKLDKLAASDFVGNIAELNSRLFASVSEVLASINASDIVCGAHVKYWNKKGSDCFAAGGGGGGGSAAATAEAVGIAVGNAAHLTVLGVFFLLFGVAIQPKTKSSFRFLTTSIAANLEDKKRFMEAYRGLIHDRKIPGISLEQEKEIARSLCEKKSADRVSSVKNFVNTQQTELVTESNSSNFLFPMGKGDGMVNLLAWPTSELGHSPFNSNGSLSSTFAMLLTGAVESTSSSATNSSSASSYGVSMSSATTSSDSVSSSCVSVSSISVSSSSAGALSYPRTLTSNAAYYSSSASRVSPISASAMPFSSASASPFSANSASPLSSALTTPRTPSSPSSSDSDEGTSSSSMLSMLKSLFLSGSDIRVGKKKGQDLEKDRKSAEEWVQECFDNGPLTFDLWFAHDGGEKTLCGDGPTVKAKTDCRNIMSSAFVSEKVRYGLGHVKVYSKEASDELHNMFVDKGMIEGVTIWKIDATAFYKSETERLIGAEAASVWSISRIKTHIIVMTADDKPPCAFLVSSYLYHPSHVYVSISYGNLDTLGAADEFWVKYRAYEWLLQSLRQRSFGLGVKAPSETSYGEEFMTVNASGKLVVDFMKPSVFVHLIKKWQRSKSGAKGGVKGGLIAGLYGGRRDPRVNKAMEFLFMAVENGDEDDIEDADIAYEAALADCERDSDKKAAGGRRGGANDGPLTIALATQASLVDSADLVAIANAAKAVEDARAERARISGDRARGGTHSSHSVRLAAGVSLEDIQTTSEKKRIAGAKTSDASRREKGHSEEAIQLSKTERLKSRAASAAKKRVAIQESAQKMEEEVEDLIRIGLQFLEDEEERLKQSIKIVCKVNEPSTAKVVEYMKENVMEEEEDNVDDLIRMSLEIVKEEDEEEELIPQTIKKARNVHVPLTKLAATAASKATALAESQVKHSRRLAILARFGFDQYDSGYVTVNNLKDLARGLNLPSVTVKVNECIAELGRQGLEKDRKPSRIKTVIE